VKGLRDIDLKFGKVVETHKRVSQYNF
jgi:hypothetical protein